MINPTAGLGGIVKSNALNFSGGPGALPETVLEQTRVAIDALPETGISILGMSHRSDWFRSILDEAELNLRALLCISEGKDSRRPNM
jgi:phosphoserine aminotransferase